jgi:hypothetical protein
MWFFGLFGLDTRRVGHDEKAGAQGAPGELAIRLTILFAADNKGSKWAIAGYGFARAPHAGFWRICPRKAGKMALC